jgi:hypothetical protein
VGGVSAIGAGLYSIGVPTDSVLKYKLVLKSDKFLLVAHVAADEADKARDIIRGTRPAEMGVHANVPLTHAAV